MNNSITITAAFTNNAPGEPNGYKWVVRLEDGRYLNHCGDPFKTEKECFADALREILSLREAEMDKP